MRLHIKDRSKNIPIVVFTFFFSVLSVFGATQKIIEEANEYGGKTIEYSFVAGDSEYSMADSAKYYFDSNGVLKRITFRMNESTKNKTGIELQEQYFSGNIIVKYKMLLTNSQKSIKGYDYIVEYVDEKNNIISYEYLIKGKLIIENSDSFVTKYPFYKLSYLVSSIFEEYKENSTGDTFTFSSKYYKGRSAITFKGNRIPLSSDDKDILLKYAKTIGNESVVDLFKYKILVVEDGNEYWLFIQDGLEKYCINNKDALITYANIGKNKKLYLILASIKDI